MCGLFINRESIPHGPIDDGVVVELDLDEASDVQAPLVTYFDVDVVGGYVVGEPSRAAKRRG